MFWNFATQDRVGMSQLLNIDFSAAMIAAELDQLKLNKFENLLLRLRDELCGASTVVSSTATSSNDYFVGSLVSWPGCLLNDYLSRRQQSLLGRILACTKQIMTEVDRVVVVGSADYLAVSQLLLSGACQPFFNELSRGERGSRPRINLLPTALDNDLIQGMLHLVGAHRELTASGLSESWALVIISDDRTWPNTQVVAQLMQQALLHNCDNNQPLQQSRTVLVAPLNSEVAKLADQWTSHEVFPMAPESPMLASLTSVALIPAALMGINVMKLVEGALQISDHFQTTKFSENRVCQLAAINSLMPPGVRYLNTTSHLLEPLGNWYRRLLANVATRACEVVTRVKPIHENVVYGHHNWLKLNCLKNYLNYNFKVESLRFDPLPLDPITSQDEPAHESVSVEPSVQFGVPQLDEFYLGQLLQLLMLATVVEAKL